MPKQALSQLPVRKAIVRVLVHFLKEIEHTEVDETLHKLANILLQVYCCLDCINVSRYSYTTTFVLCHYHRVLEVLYFDFCIFTELCNWV